MSTIAFIGLGNSGRAKGVGLDQISASGQVALVDVADHVGAGEAEQLVVALHVFVEVFEALAAILRFVQLEALNHGAHRAVEDGDAIFQNFGQRLSACVIQRFHAV